MDVNVTNIKIRYLRHIVRRERLNLYYKTIFTLKTEIIFQEVARKSNTSLYDLYKTISYTSKYGYKIFFIVFYYKINMFESK